MANREVHKMRSELGAPGTSQHEFFRQHLSVEGVAVYFEVVARLRGCRHDAHLGPEMSKAICHAATIAEQGRILASIGRMPCSAISRS